MNWSKVGEPKLVSIGEIRAVTSFFETGGRLSLLRPGTCRAPLSFFRVVRVFCGQNLLEAHHLELFCIKPHLSGYRAKLTEKFDLALLPDLEFISKRLPIRAA